MLVVPIRISRLLDMHVHMHSNLDGALTCRMVDETVSFMLSEVLS